MEAVGEDDIPAEVRSFLRDNIDSVLQLELVLLLRAHADQSWTASQVAQEFRVDAAAASELLARCVARGIVAVAGREAAYRFAPRSSELEAAIAGTADEYAARRVTIISLIFSKPPSPLRTFADAFRLRKDPRDPPRDG